MSSFEELEQLLGYTFTDKKLLELALRHSSSAVEDSAGISNERLEFLGDSVFNLLVAGYLYEKFPKADEGKLSKLKSMLVSRKSLLELAQMVSLSEFIRVGRSDTPAAKQLAAKEKDNILSNGAEAVIGAMFLDGGLAPCKELIVSHWLMKKRRLVIRDYKSRLQEVIQKIYKKIPEYRVRRSWGPEHAKTFEVEAYFEGKILGSGAGSNKKEAEQVAAKEALRNLKVIMKD